MTLSPTAKNRFHFFGRELRLVALVWSAIILLGSVRSRPGAAWALGIWDFYWNLWDPPLPWEVPMAGTALAAAGMGHLAWHWVRATNKFAHGVLALAAICVLSSMAAYAADWPAPIVALLGAFAIGVWRLARWLARSPSGLTRALDAPITDEAKDAFRRTALAQRVAALLAFDTPLHCPKLAICGPVGYGKTSLANLVRQRLEREGFVCVRFEAWHYSNTADAIRALRMAIDETLAGLPGLGGLGRFRSAARSLGARLEPAWARALMVPLEHQLALSQSELTAVLRRKVPAPARFVLFVDDLERADPDVARDLLVQAHEIVASSAMGYVFAFDREVLLKRAEARDKAFDKSLLDKVFDRTFDLPPADPQAMTAYDQDLWARASFPQDLRHDWLELSAYLPGSPRRRGRFALFVQSWPRLNESLELGFSGRTLLLLLLLEFCREGALTWLSSSNEWREELAHGALRDLFRTEGKDARPKLPLPENWDEGAEYHRVLGALRGHGDASVRPLIFGRAGGRLSLDLHVDWLLGSDIPEAIVVERLLLNASDRASLQVAMGKMPKATSETIHLGLLQTARRLYDEILNADDARRVEILATIDEVRALRAALIAGQEFLDYTAGTALAKALEQVIFFHEMKGNFAAARRGDLAILGEMIKKVRSGLPNLVGELTRRGNTTPAVLTPLLEIAHSALARKFRENFGEGRLREWLQEEESGRTLELFWRTIPTMDAVTSGELLALVSQDGVPTHLDAFAFLDHISDNLSHQPWSEQHDRVVRALWTAACLLPFAPALGWRLRQIARALSAGYAHHGPPWSGELEMPEEWVRKLQDWT